MDEDNAETLVDIRDSQLMGGYRGITEDRITSMSSILLSLSNNTSYTTVNRMIDEVLNLNGKNRGVIQSWDEENNESDDSVKSLESTDEIITRLLIDEINSFIKNLESSVRPDNKNSLNPLKAIVVKFIQTNFYYFHAELYKPKLYIDVINEYINYPSQFNDFYSEISKRVSQVNPDSPIIDLLKSQNNSALLRPVTNIMEAGKASPEELKIFLEGRKEYREMIKPQLTHVCDSLDINIKTYQDNINKVTNKLVTTLADQELTRRFNQIILLNGL